MSAQTADRPLTRSLQLETALASLASSRRAFANHSSFWPDFCTNVKKGALRLVQSEHNPFVINIIFQKLRRKNVKKRAKLTLIRPFSGCFRDFSGTTTLRRIAASPASFSLATSSCLCSSTYSPQSLSQAKSLLLATGSWLLATGSWLLAIGYWLLTIGYWLLALGYWLLALGSWLLALGSWLLALGSWLLATGYWLLALGSWLLATGYWLLALGYWLLAVDYWLLLIGYSRSSRSLGPLVPRSLPLRMEGMQRYGRGMEKV